MSSDFIVEQLIPAAPRLFELLEKFNGIKVLVIGDLTLDEFVTGEVERVSREAPVLILRHEYTRQVPGGGANAIYNLAKLGAQVKAVGLVGTDTQGEAIRDIFQKGGIEITGIFLDSKRPTVTKTRIAGHARQSVTQQIVRIDRKSEQPPSQILQDNLAYYIDSQIAKVGAVVCSDYGDGVLSQSVIASACGHSRVIVDAQKDLHRYKGATLFTPNLPEAEQAVGYAITDEATLNRAGEDLLTITGAKQILITRGEAGMSLFERFATGVKTSSVPAFNKREVFDVTGAGDTVVAALTLALCAGGTFWEAAVLGNLAASLVVRQFGTATTKPEEMQKALSFLLEETVEVR